MVGLCAAAGHQETSSDTEIQTGLRALRRGRASPSALVRHYSRNVDGSWLELLPRSLYLSQAA